MKAGSRRPSHRVYGAASPQDKAVDNRKSAKTPRPAGRVEKSRAIVRPALPPGGVAPDPTASQSFPRGFSTVVERYCGYAWP